MTDQISERPTDFLKIQQELDRSFQECYRLCEKMPQFLRQHLRDDPIHQIGLERTRKWLQPVANEVYREMAYAMYRVLPWLQPQDFKTEGEPVNFYFWPGYRPALAGRRLYYKAEEAATDFQSAGVGIWGDPKAVGREKEWMIYHDCSHSHWYHYATNRPADMEFFPGSVYLWFNSQLPRASANPADLVNSLTVTTSDTADLDEDPRFVVCKLTGNSDQWGEQLKDTINGRVGPHYRRLPDLVFPDRPDKPKEKEANWRRVRCMLLALFMHAAFRDQAPEWLDTLRQELTNTNLTGVIDLRRAAQDEIAQDWSDLRQGRKPFQCWSTITLQPMLNAFPSGFNAADSGMRQFELDNESIGSASLFCSVFLRREYIAVVRDFVRKVYAMMRNFEAAIANRNLLIQTRLSETSQSAYLLHHEFNVLLTNRYGDIYHYMGDNGPQHVAERKMAWRAVTAHANLLDLWSQVFLAKLQEKLPELRKRFLTPLLNLNERNQLRQALAFVAAEVYSFVKPYANVEIETLSKAPALKLSAEEHNVCFLLVAEMIRNFCQHEREAHSGHWSSDLTSSTLTISLRCGTSELEPPRSKTFECLGLFLGELQIGRAKVSMEKSGELIWRVELRISEERKA